MNARCTQLCHLQLGKGRDMMEALCAKLTGQTLRETPPVTDGELIAYFPEAWTCKSQFLDSTFQDIPFEEPHLVDDLLRSAPPQQRRRESRTFSLSNRDGNPKVLLIRSEAKGIGRL